MAYPTCLMLGCNERAFVVLSSSVTGGGLPWDRSDLQWGSSLHWGGSEVEGRWQYSQPLGLKVLSWRGILTAQPCLPQTFCRERKWYCIWPKSGCRGKDWGGNPGNLEIMSTYFLWSLIIAPIWYPPSYYLGKQDQAPRNPELYYSPRFSLSNRSNNACQVLAYRKHSVLRYCNRLNGGSKDTSVSQNLQMWPHLEKGTMQN